MSAPSKLLSALTAPDRQSRIRELADLMREQRFGGDDGLTMPIARAAGFTLAEIEAYSDEAITLARTGAPVVLPPKAERTIGRDLVRKARAIRRRLQRDAR